MMNAMPLTLAEITAQPSLVTSQPRLRNGKDVYLRPLKVRDVLALSAFLNKLSSETKRFSPFPTYDLKMAQELCREIGKYDKLRFAVENPSGVIVDRKSVG